MKKEKKISHYYTSFFREIAISRMKKITTDDPIYDVLSSTRKYYSF